MSTNEVIQFEYQNYIQKYHWKDSISGITDVKGDGNCGYRSIAVYRDVLQEKWPLIRQNLLVEVNTSPLFAIDRFLVNLWGKTLD